MEVISWTILGGLALAVCLIAPCAAGEVDLARGGGEIEGTVVNLSRNGQPAARIEVALRAEVDGELATLGLTTTDEQGRFAFMDVPLNLDLTYLPGTNFDGIHYPGPPLRINHQRPTAVVRLAVRETIADPSPLILRQHEIVIEAGEGLVFVTEGMLVDNPTQRTFVGRSQIQDMPPVTFELGVPSEFERLTFENEFFGRRFLPINGRLVTSAPWEPGERWLRFTYCLPNEQAKRVWTRKLDAPCEQLRVRVRQGSAEQVRCNLPTLDNSPDGEVGFQSAGEVLPAGFAVQVELDALPVPWMVYARRGALILLASAIAIAGWLARRSKSTVAGKASQPAPLRSGTPHGKDSSAAAAAATVSRRNQKRSRRASA